jgi:hypothetical protein
VPAPLLRTRDGAGRQEKMTVVARYPDSTKTSLEQRLRARARDRWPQIASLQIRHRGVFSYVDATLTDDTTLKLCRLRYVGSASQWQFAIYRASHDDYDESVFFTGLPVGTCQDALDTACGLYLNDPTAWTRPPTNLRARPLRPRPLACGRCRARRPTPGGPPRYRQAGGGPPSRDSRHRAERQPGGAWLACQPRLSRESVTSGASPPRSGARLSGGAAGTCQGRSFVASLRADP